MPQPAARNVQLLSWLGADANGQEPATAIAGASRGGFQLAEASESGEHSESGEDASSESSSKSGTTSGEKSESSESGEGTRSTTQTRSSSDNDSDADHGTGCDDFKSASAGSRPGVIGSSTGTTGTGANSHMFNGGKAPSAATN